MQEEQQKEIFNGWLKQHKGIFFKVVRAYAFNIHDQDDLFQEIALQVWKSIPDFRGDSKPSTWIYRVALFTALTWTRQERKQPPTESIADAPQALMPQEAEQDERIGWLYEQIAQLEPIDRSICLLMFEGFRYREMAEMLGISESNVGVRVHRIKQQLQRKSQEVTSV